MILNQHLLLLRDDNPAGIADHAAELAQISGNFPAQSELPLGISIKHQLPVFGSEQLMVEPFPNGKREQVEVILGEMKIIEDLPRSVPLFGLDVGGLRSYVLSRVYCLSAEFPVSFRQLGHIVAPPWPALDKAFGDQLLVREFNRRRAERQKFGELADGGQAVFLCENSVYDVLFDHLVDFLVSVVWAGIGYRRTKVRKKIHF